ncbi:GNAT family N-acetyltransferase [Solibacillus sp. FSL H8-0538]|uniref:GNAT family N-acetyltransferase n=1 Tax=Solibacillus sp. FSL H8-0538 TaxID=2921400 RepID=UPI0030FAC7F4
MTKKMEKKYIPLAEFFQNASQKQMTLTYDEIENIMGQELPNAAYLNLSWWKKTKQPLTHYLSWLNSEYNVIDVKLSRSVTFSRLNHSTEDELDVSATKNTFIIRSIETDDARAFINLQEEIFEQTNFEYFGPNEQGLTVQQIRKMMADWRKQKNCTILMCIFNGQFAGYAMIQGSVSTRTKHIATVRIAVKQQFKGNGIGSALLEQCEVWAKENSIERLEAAIMSHNETALSLFKKHNYLVEGTRHHGVKIEADYFDELYHGKLI